MDVSSSIELSTLSSQRISEREKPAQLKVFSFNVPNEQDLDLEKLVYQIGPEFHLICLQSLFKEQNHQLLFDKLKPLKRYRFLMRNEREKNTKNVLFVSGIFFATTLKIVKWEFESFDVLEKDGALLKSHPHHSLKGLLSVLLEYSNQHFWVFVSQFQGIKKSQVELEQSQFFFHYLEKSAKIMHSKVWTNEKQPLDYKHIDLTYGSCIEIMYGKLCGLYLRSDLRIGVNIFFTFLKNIHIMNNLKLLYVFC